MTKTVGFNLLGNYGRLGNSMFQYAAVLGAARTSGHIPMCNISGIPLFAECFELGSVTNGQIEPDLILNEKEFLYQDIVHNLPKDKSVDLRGYFQTEKYFKHIDEEIRSNFTFKENIRNAAVKKIPNEVCVSVHVRRGDYIALSEFHPTQSVEYYEEALTKFPDHQPIFFSDDPSWCREKFSHITNDPIFIESDKDLNLSSSRESDISGYIDMCAMSLCNDHIIANSSFSWWGAWLGQGRVVAPKNWFGPAKRISDHSDIYCDGWTLV